jgi:hemerythrin-like domain-containing protein
MRITDALLAEHMVFHSLFDRLEAQTPGLRTLGEVRALVDLIAAVMEAHGRVEDDLLMAPLDHCLSQIGQTDKIHDEHEAIDASLRSARNARRLDRAKRDLLRAVQLARQHFDREERLIFPLAEKQLSARTQAALGKRWEERRKASVF